MENDIEMEYRAFKVDGHGRPFVGSRGCAGDSGGPALWRNSQGLLTLGGVMSYTDVGGFIDPCPSERGETGIAFVPRPFIDAFVPSLTVTKLNIGTGTVTSNPGGITCSGTGSDDCFEQYLLDSVVTLTATPAADSFFQGWSGPCAAAGNAPTCTLLVNSGLYVGATFLKRQQPLTVRVQPAASGNAVRVNPPNTSCTGICIPSFQFGTSVTLTALPAPGFVLGNWSGSCAGSHTNTCTVQMTAARNTTASFCPAGDICCINPGSCPTCNPKQCPRSVPDCCL